MVKKPTAIWTFEQKQPQRCTLAFPANLGGSSWGFIFPKVRGENFPRCLKPLPCGCFLKWWASPTTMGFPTKNDHFEVFWGYHDFWNHYHVMVKRNARCQHQVEVLSRWISHQLTPWNISPENRWLGDDSFPFKMVRSLFRGHVNFSRGVYIRLVLKPHPFASAIFRNKVPWNSTKFIKITTYPMGGSKSIY